MCHKPTWNIAIPVASWCCCSIFEIFWIPIGEIVLGGVCLAMRVGHKRLASYSYKSSKCVHGVSVMIAATERVCFGQGLKVAPWCPPSIHWRHCTTRCPSSRWTSSSPRCVRTEARHNSRGSNVSG